MTDLLVVGAGLAGLYAAALAARRGAAVTLVAEGRGGLELSHGCIDILMEPSTRGDLPPAHPYRQAGDERVRQALHEFQLLAAEHELPYVGSPDEALVLPTAAGGRRRTGLAPKAQAAGDLRQPAPFHLAGFAHFRDFAAEYAALRLRQAGQPVAGVVSLPLPQLPGGRDLYATDLARLFDRSDWRDEALRAWKPPLGGVKRLGVPAVLGLRSAPAALQAAEDRLGIRLFEIPTLPPSVPGLRLERALRRAAQAAGAQLIEGARATGLVDAGAGNVVAGVVYHSAGGPRPLRARATLLASGGPLHGGLVYRQRGQVQESIFDLPVRHPADRSDWTASAPLEAQPYSSLGISVDPHFRPLSPDGSPAFENLFAAGGLLAGIDRTIQGSRQGIDLVSAFCAVQEALA